MNHRSFWLIVGAASLAASIVAVLAFPGTILQPLLCLWVLAVGPGLTIMRYARVNPSRGQALLALLLSFFVDLLIAGLQMLTGISAPPGTLFAILGLCLIGIGLRLFIEHLFGRGSTVTPVSHPTGQQA